MGVQTLEEHQCLNLGPIPDTLEDKSQLPILKIEGIESRLQI